MSIERPYVRARLDAELHAALIAAISKLVGSPHVINFPQRQVD